MVQNETPAASKPKRGRSPAYPGIPLEEALSKAEIIRKLEGRNEANVNTILAHWGYKPKSGQGLVVLSALMKFGLMTDNGSGENRKARLTDLSVRILLDNRPDSAERLALIKEAALAPSIHKELWDKYQGSLPSDLNLCYYLRSDRDFQENAAQELVREFRETLDYAKIEKSANISLEGKEKPKPEGDIIMPNVSIAETPQIQQSEGQKQAIPSTVRQIQIPYTLNNWAKLEAGFPMSEEDWVQFMAVLTAMKPALVTKRTTEKAVTPQPQVKRGLTEEAVALLKKVDSGGVPMFASEGLTRIAIENGVVVTTTDTPEQVIKALREIDARSIN